MLQGLPIDERSRTTSGRLFQRRGWTSTGVVALALLCGCDTKSASSSLDDPAMQAAQSDRASSAPIATASTVQSNDTQQVLDMSQQLPRREGGRVFFPELGWVEEHTFWQNYLDAPESLPLSLDLYAAHQLRQEYEQEQMAGLNE